MRSRLYNLTDADADFLHELLVEHYLTCENAIAEGFIADDEEKQIFEARARRARDLEEALSETRSDP